MTSIKFSAVSPGGLEESLVSLGVIEGNRCQITMNTGNDISPTGSDITLVRSGVLQTELEISLFL